MRAMSRGQKGKKFEISGKYKNWEKSVKKSI
jgi:hypothetical protein